MPRLPILLPLDKISFEASVACLAGDRGFIAINAKNSPRKEKRFSIVASLPCHTFSFSSGFATTDGHTRIDTLENALKDFVRLSETWPIDSHLPFSGGGIGYISFEGARTLAGFKPANGFARFPQCHFGIYNTALVFDHVENAGFIVSNGEAYKLAQEKALALQEKLLCPPERVFNGTLYCTFDQKEERHAPIEAEFSKVIESARQWLRSESVSRLHLMRKTAKPIQTEDPIQEFLTHGKENHARVIFSHEDAYAIAFAEGAPDEIFLDEAFGWRGLSEITLHSETVGEPVDRAMSFLIDNEGEHRAFYGGSFGIFDSKKIVLRKIRNVASFADGALETFLGIDVTA